MILSLLIFKDHKPEIHVGDNVSDELPGCNSLEIILAFYALVSMLNILHFTLRISAERIGEKKQQQTTLPQKKSGGLLHSRIQSTLSDTGIFIILSCRSPEEQIKASKT